jgi:hypothetical protein
MRGYDRQNRRKTNFFRVIAQQAPELSGPGVSVNGLWGAPPPPPPPGGGGGAGGGGPPNGGAHGPPPAKAGRQQTKKPRSGFILSISSYRLYGLSVFNQRCGLVSAFTYQRPSPLATRRSPHPAPRPVGAGRASRAVRPPLGGARAALRIAERGHRRPADAGAAHARRLKCRRHANEKTAQAVLSLRF